MNSCPVVSAIGPECPELCVSLQFHLGWRAQDGWAISEFPVGVAFDNEPCLVVLKGCAPVKKRLRGRAQVWQTLKRCSLMENILFWTMLEMRACCFP